MTSDVFRIRDFEVRNRLFVGTGKYATYELMQEALEASGCHVVTVAVRRERLVDKQGRSLLDYLDLKKYVILPNTAGCFSAEDAIRVSMLGRDLLEKQGNKGAGWVKLEVPASAVGLEGGNVTGMCFSAFGGGKVLWDAAGRSTTSN